MPFSDETVTMTCVCGCGSIRFDYYADDPEFCVTPYAIMTKPIVVPDGILGRIRLAWGVLFGRYPEPTMIIDQDEWPLLHEFLHKAEAIRDSTPEALSEKEEK